MSEENQVLEYYLEVPGKNGESKREWRAAEELRTADITVKAARLIGAENVVFGVISNELPIEERQIIEKELAAAGMKVDFYTSLQYPNATNRAILMQMSKVSPIRSDRRFLATSA